MLAITGCVRADLRESDLPLLPSRAELLGIGLDLDDVAEERELRRRLLYFDGTIDVEYELETADGAPEPFYLSVTVTFDTSDAGARLGFAAQKAGGGLGARLGDLTMRVDDAFYRFGDESYFATMVGEVGPIGTVFGTRVGRKTYWLSLAGLYFDDVEQWRAFIEPKLEYLRTYEITRR